MLKSHRIDTYYTNRAGGVYNCPPPLGSPRFARGTAWGAWVRFPLLARGTIGRGLSGILVFVNFETALIGERVIRLHRKPERP
jgi:hypothetical protein